MPRTSEQIRPTTEFPVPAVFRQFLDLERTAEHLWKNMPHVMPGLLQTPHYAEAALSAATGKAPDHPDVAEGVALRMARADEFLLRLATRRPQKLTVVIHEAVFRHTLGGIEVMRKQADHLLAVMDGHPDLVSVAVVGAGAGGPDGARTFEIFEDERDAVAVFLERDESSDELLTDRAAVLRYRSVMEGLLRSAVRGDDARMRIEQLTSQM